MKRTIIFWLVATVTAVLAIWVTFTTFISFSGFAAAYGKAVLGALAFYLFDKTLLKEVDTINEIKKGNTAYAIFILSYALIVAACVATG